MYNPQKFLTTVGSTPFSPPKKYAINFLSTSYRGPISCPMIQLSKAAFPRPGAVLGIVLVGWHCPQNCQLVETNASGQLGGRLGFSAPTIYTKMEDMEDTF